MCGVHAELRVTRPVVGRRPRHQLPLATLDRKDIAVLRFVTLLAAAVRRAPALVLAVVLVLTGAFAVLAQEVEIAAGNEGFAPDNPELLATEVIAERFGDSSEDVMQVLITGPDVISADGLAAVEALTDAVLGSPRADLLSSNEQRPPVVSYLAPVQMALAEPPPGRLRRPWVNR
jgi:uncharacterized membrane protein YdfJ with MMPL/SSD domain